MLDELQNLGQSDISLIKKHELKERFEKTQNEVAAKLKAKIASASKEVRT
jgi:hypothetical protein